MGRPAGEAHEIEARVAQLPSHGLKPVQDEPALVARAVGHGFGELAVAFGGLIISCPPAQHAGE